MEWFHLYEMFNPGQSIRTERSVLPGAGWQNVLESIVMMAAQLCECTKSHWTVYFFFSFFAVLGIKPRISHMPGKHSTSKPHPQLKLWHFKWMNCMHVNYISINLLLKHNKHEVDLIRGSHSWSWHSCFSLSFTHTVRWKQRWLSFFFG